MPVVPDNDAWLAAKDEEQGRLRRLITVVQAQEYSPLLAITGMVHVDLRRGSVNVASPLSTAARRSRWRPAILAATVIALIVAPSALAASATNINIQVPAGFTISGTITDNTGAPLQGAYVSASGTANGGSGSAMTDAAGKYTIDGLLPTSYSIFVSAPSARNLLDGYYTTANANHHTTSSTSATKVTVGPNKTGINVKLPVGFSISGTITDTANKPLQNAGVSAFGSSFGYTSTDAAGKFTIIGLAAGSYTVTATAPSGKNLQSGYYTTANSNHFTIVSTSASKLTLGPNKSGIVIKLPAGYSISGTIRNSSGTALADVSVSPMSSTYFFGRSGTTDANGKYTVTGLAAGSFKLVIDPDSDSQYMYGYYTTAYSTHFTSAYGGASGITVGPSKTAIDIKLATGRTISGKVMTTGGAPIEGAEITADNLGHPRDAETDASGNYTIKGLSSTGQTLQVEPPYGDNYMTGFYTSAPGYHFTSQWAGATKVTVPPNATGIDMKLPKGASIAGKITGPGGTPLSFAYVSATKSDYSGYAFTEADGTYIINGLGSGTYKVRVDVYSGNYQSGYYTTSNGAHFTVAVGSATGVTVSP